jgi:hypothetical protein
MHGYIMPSAGTKNNLQNPFTWLHYANKAGARMTAKPGNFRLCATSIQKTGGELPVSIDASLLLPFGSAT